MHSKLRILLPVIIGICLFFHTKGQPDTLYIYEDVVVYDTIYIRDTIYTKSAEKELFPINQRSQFILQLDTVKHNTNLLQLSNGKAATFPLNSIILYGNYCNNLKNSNGMKKLNFFGVVFLAFQTMVLSQTHYEMSIGSGVWWEHGKMDYVVKPYTSLYSVGFYAKKDLGKTPFGLKTGIEYSYFCRSRDYKFDGTVGVWHSIEGWEFERLNSHYGAGQHSIAVPVLFYFDRYRVQPFMGCSYKYLTTGPQYDYFGDRTFGVSHNIGVAMGCNIGLANRIAVNMEFRHNFTSDYSEGIDGPNNMGPSVLGENFFLRNRQTRFSLVYTFKKRKIVPPDEFSSDATPPARSR